MSGSKCLKAADTVLLMQTGKDTHTHPQTNKPRESAQSVILGNCTVAIMEIATNLDFNVARPLCKALA
jgi:hypothetical protein